MLKKNQLSIFVRLKKRFPFIEIWFQESEELNKIQPQRSELSRIVHACSVMEEMDIINEDIFITSLCAISKGEGNDETETSSSCLIKVPSSYISQKEKVYDEFDSSSLMQKQTPKPQALKSSEPIIPLYPVPPTAYKKEELIEGFYASSSSSKTFDSIERTSRTFSKVINNHILYAMVNYIMCSRFIYFVLYFESEMMSNISMNRLKIFDPGGNLMI